MIEFESHGPLPGPPLEGEGECSGVFHAILKSLIFPTGKGSPSPDLKSGRAGERSFPDKEKVLNSTGIIVSNIMRNEEVAKGN
jgi:hypothetical protein